MTYRACGQLCCDHSDAEYQGVVLTRAAALVQARQIVSDNLNPTSHRACNCRERIAAGEWDRELSVRSVMTAMGWGASG